MTALTETVLPLNPFKYEVPEDVTKSSERIMHFWLGAMSPLWVPFMAATSLGVGAWMMGRGMRDALSKSGLSLEDMMEQSEAFKGLMQVEKAIDEAVAAPMHAFVEAEATIADQVMGDYSPPKEAVEAAYRAEAEAAEAAAPEAVVSEAVVSEVVTPKVSAKPRSNPRRR